MDFFSNAMQWFIDGGPVMWPLLFCSLIALAIGWERFLYYRAEDSGHKFVEEYRELLEDKKYDEAETLAKETKGEAARLAAETLVKRSTQEERIEAFMTPRAERALDRAERYLPYLSVIVMLSPILGLLGTITGMIASFNALDQRMENPMAVTAGIGEALITTVFGLCIAVVAIVIHTYFRHRFKKLSLDVEEVTNVTVDAVIRSRS